MTEHGGKSQSEWKNLRTEFRNAWNLPPCGDFRNICIALNEH